MILLLAAAGSAMAAEPYPYDLAFSHRRLALSSAVAVSPDGERIAYVVQAPPEDINRDMPLSGSGSSTPPLSLGNKVHVIGSQGGQASVACGEAGNSWFPSWSPDSNRLAMYGDAGGQTALWIYSASTRQCREFRDIPIRPTPLDGGKPRWSPDGSTLYVPTMSRAPASPSAPAVHDSRAASVTIYRGGDEIDPEQRRRTAERGWFSDAMRGMHAAAISAVATDTGAARIVVPADVEPPPMAVRVSPSGRWLSYLTLFKRSGDIADSKLTMGLLAVAADGGTSKPITNELVNLNLDTAAAYYVWHPSADRLAYIQDGKLWLVEFDEQGISGLLHRMSSCSRVMDERCWSRRR
jgi:dipeptidyl aminopeptidase/acylaminoacyl peptidase